MATMKVLRAHQQTNEVYAFDLNPNGEIVGVSGPLDNKYRKSDVVPKRRYRRTSDQLAWAQVQPWTSDIARELVTDGD